MSHVAIRAEGLSKKYRIGRRESYRALRDVLMSGVTAPLRAVSGRRQGRNGAGGRPVNEFWALRDLNFEIEHGEAVGIIGRNGAGKSTLLKILSRITEPTAGQADIYGRVRSLLEVGTGFHSELTGRENIFLMAAILGMRRAEVERRFDEIVDFADVPRFIDTAVKHYSTGMYLRLAFAVAAYLEPDILLVDEVLAVGDATFQKKCLGKLGDVAREGRTVLFVSHNLQAVAQLTTRSLVINGGHCIFDGPTSEALAHYHAEARQDSAAVPAYENTSPHRPPNYLERAKVVTSGEFGRHDWGEPIDFEFELRITEPVESLAFSFQVLNELQVPVCQFWFWEPDAPFRRLPGVHRLKCHVPKLRLYMGDYSLSTSLTERRGDTVLENLASICPFEVTMQNAPREEYDWAPGASVYLEDAAWEY